MRDEMWRKTRVYWMCRDRAEGAVSHRLCNKEGCRCRCHVLVAGWRWDGGRWRPLKAVAWAP